MNTDDERPLKDITSLPRHNIKRVCERLSLNPITLRAWERRYKFLRPARTKQGYRLYSDKDIALLAWLKARVDEGIPIGNAITELNTIRPDLEVPVDTDEAAAEVGELLSAIEQVEAALRQLKTIARRKRR